MVAAAGWLAADNVAEAQVDLPALANARVLNGDTPGLVTVAWDSVACSFDYTLQRMDGDATRNALYAGQGWL